MEDHPRMAEWITANNIHRISFNMRDFGGQTLKPQWLYSQFEWVKDILLFKTTPSTPSKKRKKKAHQEVSVNTVKQQRFTHNGRTHDMPIRHPI